MNQASLIVLSLAILSPALIVTLAYIVMKFFVYFKKKHEDYIWILCAAGLNFAEIGSIIFISRHSIYEWLFESGRSPLMKDQVKRLNKIYKIIKTEGIGQRDLSKYLHEKNYFYTVRGTVRGKAHSLFDFLKELNLNERIIRAALKDIKERITKDRQEYEKHKQFLRKHGLEGATEESIRIAVSRHRSIG